jgi:hypothetical protein
MMWRNCQGFNAECSELPASAVADARSGAASTEEINPIKRAGGTRLEAGQVD